MNKSLASDTTDAAFDLERKRFLNCCTVIIPATWWFTIRIGLIIIESDQRCQQGQAICLVVRNITTELNDQYIRIVWLILKSVCLKINL